MIAPLPERFFGSGAVFWGIRYDGHFANDAFVGARIVVERDGVETEIE